MQMIIIENCVQMWYKIVKFGNRQKGLNDCFPYTWGCFVE